MKKIAVFQKDLQVGGIQKSLMNFLQQIDKNKYQIDLYLFNRNIFFSEEIPKEINIIYVKPSFPLLKFIYFDWAKTIKKNIYKNMKQEYDVVIDFDSYQFDTAYGAISVNAKKRVLWIHNDVKIKLKNEFKYRILHYFFKTKYKYFDEFVAVSKGVVQPFIEENKIIDKKIHVIPNYINTNEILEKSKEDIDFKINNDMYNLVSVGRLCHQKGYDILLGYIEEIIKKRKDFHLYIIGDGPDKKTIKKIIEDKNMDSFVTLLGNQKNPFKYMKYMDGFALTSRYEGQGMVIMEAKCLGLDIFISKHLEKYNEDIAGTENIVDDIINAKKNNNKITNNLMEYNNSITKRIEELLG